LLSSLKDDKDEITLVSLELEVRILFFWGVHLFLNIKSPLLSEFYSLSKKQEDY
jgi:hypothetical protein